MVGGRDGVCFGLGDGRVAVRLLVWLGVERRGGGWGYWGTRGRLEDLEPLSDLLCRERAGEGQLEKLDG
jgi:hypothetical protein